VQPALHMVETQSQQDWIISQHCLSPEVQVMQQPQSVISTLQIPMVRLQVQTVTPFMVQQSEQRPPINAVHRFCTMLLAMGSSQTHVMRTPLATFSKRKVQRGTIIQLEETGETDGTPTPEVGIPGIP